MGQCAELSQWKPLFFCPVRMSQMMMACGSSLVSISGLKVTTYLEDITTTHGASDNYLHSAGSFTTRVTLLKMGPDPVPIANKHQLNTNIDPMDQKFSYSSPSIEHFTGFLSKCSFLLKRLKHICK